MNLTDEDKKDIKETAIFLIKCWATVSITVVGLIVIGITCKEN